MMYRLHDEPRAGWRVITIDAESIREPANFIIALIDASLADKQLRKFLLNKWKQAGSWLRGLLGEVEMQTPWDLDVKLKFKEAIASDWQERGNVLLQTLRSYDAGEKLLFLIDELPVMLALFEDNGVADPEIRTFLYWFRQFRIDPGSGLANCRFLIGGSIGIEHSLSRIQAAPAFNDFERIALRELATDRAGAFLERLLRSSRIDLSTQTQRRILGLVGTPIPYFIQLFVAELASARASGEKSMGPSTAERLYHERVLGVGSKSYFQHYFDRLRHYEKPLERAAKAILKELAVASPTAVQSSVLRAHFRREFGESATDEAFSDLLWNLENDFYIRASPADDGYHFASKVLCDWWRRYYAF